MGFRSFRRAARVLRARRAARRHTLLAGPERLESRQMLASWTGDIPNGTIWTNSEVQQITGNVRVPAGSTLTVQAGTTVKFDAGTNLTVDGTLTAVGATGQEILFTSFRDGAGAVAGDWGAIRFNPGSQASTLDRVRVRFGGAFQAAEVLVGANINISNSTFSDTGFQIAGLGITASNPTLTNLTFQNNFYAASMDLASSPVVNGVTATGNNINGMLINGGSLASDVTWNAQGMVYVVNGTLTVPQGRKLTLGAGQIVKPVVLFAFGAGGFVVDGTLTAQGTAQQPVIITSLADDAAGGDTNNNGAANAPAAGDWGAITFNATSGASSLDNATVRYGSFFQPGQLVVGANIAVSNSTISHGTFNSAGIHVTASSPTLTNLTLSNNHAAASMDLASNPTITGASVSNNAINGMRIDGGNLAVDATWNTPSLVYVINGTLTVPAARKLTIGAGQVVKAVNIVNFNVPGIVIDGTLTAQGTAARPVIFSSFQDDSAGGDTNNNGAANGPLGGDWFGLQINGSGNNVLDRVEVRYGGNTFGGSIVGAGILDNGAPLTLTNSVIRNSGSNGLRVVGANPFVHNVTFQANGSGAVSANLASKPTIRNVTISGNRFNGMLLEGNSLPANATWDNPDIVYIPQAGTTTIPAGVTLTIAPGVVVKPAINIFLTNFLRVEGTLKAQGTVEQPIILTSLSDASAGGSTNQDSVLGVGQGYAIFFATTSAGNILDRVEVRYGTSMEFVDNAFLGTLNVAGSLALSNSIVRNSGHVAIFVGPNASATLTNNLIFSQLSGIQAQANSTLTAINNTIDGSVFFGLILDAPIAILTNNLITNSGSAGVRQASPTNLTMQFNNVFSTAPGSTNYNGLPDRTGQSGNLSLDPKYFSRANLEYRLRPGSPVSDAGTSSGAPLTDFFGNPRFDDPNITGRGDGSGFDMGAIEVQEIAISTTDLATLNVTGPTTGSQGLEATINWTVKNVGTGTASGVWSDAIYLSDTPTWTPLAKFLKRVTHTGDLGPEQSYSATTSVTLNNVLPGNHYFIVRSNDLSDVFEGLATANNAGVAPLAINFAMPTLTLNTPLNDQFTAVGQSKFYQITVAGGQTLDFALDSQATGGTTELYVSRGAVPSRSEFDFSSIALAPDQKLTVPFTQPGTYYVLAYAAAAPAATSAFTITASQAPFGVKNVSPATAGNAGQVTITINGSALTADTEASLIAPDNSVIAALATFLTDATKLQATFDLTGKAPGLYDVRIKRGALTATAADSLTVTAGTAGRLNVSFLVPGIIRAGRQGTVTVEYFNEGGADLPAPILTVTANTKTLRFANDANARGDTVEFLAISRTGPAGVLAPGAKGSIDINFIATSDVTNGNLLFTLSRQSSQSDTTPLDWAAVKDKLRPANVPADTWNAVYANFTADVGTTLGEFQALLDRQATYLSRLGRYVADEGQLLAMALQQAGNFGAIAQRYSLGAFGRGVPDPTAFSALTDAAGNVTVLAGALARTFLIQANQTYRGANGERGVLTRENGAYRLKEADGGLVVFRPDGRLDYRQDSNGNRVTSGYTGNRMTSYTDDFGNTTAFRYNAQGRIDQITDPVGRITSLTYDSAGEHVLSSSNAQGTTQFAYVSGQGAQREHALASVTYPDGSHTFNVYDGRGRLIKTSLDGGANEVQVAYDGLGGVTSTNAKQESTTILVNEFGRPGLLQNPLGNVTRYFYDHQQNLTHVANADGSTVAITSDSRGNPASTIDSSGQRVDATFDSVFNTLQLLRDQRGNALTFRMDARGNALSQTYPDGSIERFSYDADGRVTTELDALGNEIRFTYDTHSQLIRQDFADGSQFSFTYDAHRNLTAATNANGTTTYSYDLATDRLTKVTYPDGRFLTFTYDVAGRRTKTVDQGGFTVNYSYDTLGRLKALTDGSNAAIASYIYDSVGRLQRQDSGNGTFATYAYDAAGRVTSLVNRAADNSILSKFDYTYDSLGRRLSLTTTEGVTTYGYDSTGQLISAILPDGRNIAFQYDAAGNRVAVTDAGATTSYTTNNMNQYTAAGSLQFAYDASGNLISRTDGTGTTSYSYNLQGRLASVITPTGAVNYIYDALGTRIAAVQNGQRTNFLVDPIGYGNVVAAYDGSGSLQAHYTYAGGLVSQTSSSGDPQYYHFDATGNTAQLSGASGTILNTYTYLPYGEIRSATGTSPNPFTFNGQLGVQSEGNGVYFMRNRFYDSMVGRFTQADPIGLAGGLNLYRFANNNPISFADPQGLNEAVIAQLLERLTAHIPAAARPDILDDGIWWAYKNAQRAGLDFDESKLISNLRSLLRARGLTGAPAAAIETATLDGALGGTIVTGEGAGAALAEGTVLEGSLVTSSQGVGASASSGAVAAESTSLLGPLGLVLAGVIGATYAADIGAETGHSFNDALADSFFNGEIEFGDAVLKKAEELGISPRAVLTLVRSGELKRVGPEDPNEIAGPLGFAAQHFVTADETFPYTILFENKPTATAPALVVAVTQQLDAKLDWTTFELGDFGFGPYIVDVPEGRRFYSTRVDATSTVGEYVDVTADFDAATGKVTWTFTSVDPTTGAIPQGVTDGFLPPEDGAGSGQGFVTYRVRPKSGPATGQTVPALARVIFDAGLPGESFLDTPVFTNTFDVGGPTSSVNALPAVQNAVFTLQWTGSDDTGGSGVGRYDVFVSDNNGPFTLFQDDTPLTAATFTGERGHTYRFYAVATDNVGHTESAPATFDTQTIISTHPWHNAPLPLDVNRDTAISVIDAILVINYLNGGTPAGPGPVPASAFTGTPSQPFGFIDTNGEDNISPIDALLVINQIAGSGEGEGEHQPAAPAREIDLSPLATPMPSNSSSTFSLAVVNAALGLFLAQPNESPPQELNPASRTNPSPHSLRQPPASGNPNNHLLQERVSGALAATAPKLESPRSAPEIDPALLELLAAAAAGRAVGNILR